MMHDDGNAVVVDDDDDDTDDNYNILFNLTVIKDQ